MFKVKFPKHVDDKTTPATADNQEMDQQELANKSVPSAEVQTKNKTFISVGSEITGNLCVTGDIFINGNIIGNIVVVNGCITVMRSGKIEGDLTAPQITINGMVTGHCKADALEIQEHGQLNGVASANRFAIKNGGIFIGKSEHVEAKSQPVERVNAAVTLVVSEPVEHVDKKQEQEKPTVHVNGPLKNSAA